MLLLAVSNLTHRKVRTLLSVLAVAIAITLLLVLVGLTGGTLHEVAGRMESVQAEIMVRDQHFDLGSMSGGKLWEKEIPRIEELQIGKEKAVSRVMPVFLGRMKLAGLSQNVFGIQPKDFPYFAGTRRLLAGEVFKDIDSSAAALRQEEQPNAPQAADDPLPLIIDQRLAQASGLKVGEAAGYGGIPGRIAAVVETGVAGRVFAPINRLRAANGVAGPTAHMFFVKARADLTNNQLQQLCEQIEQATHRSASLIANYGQVLAGNFRNLTIFVNLVSVIALVICFLFILVTMYTIVLERGKEIAILQSLGASRAAVLRQTVQEATLICTLGTAAGVGLSFAVRWLIETVQPLMTVEIRLPWLILAVVIGLGGGVLSSLYPGYLALRHDPVEILSFE